MESTGAVVTRVDARDVNPANLTTPAGNIVNTYFRLWCKYEREATFHGQ